MRNHAARIVFAITIAVILIGASAGQADATEARSFKVKFADCIEFVGVAPIDPSRADRLVPDRFVVASLFQIPGGASIVVRVSDCDKVSVDDEPATRGTVAHIGININAPDGDGNINNYTLTYASNHRSLVEKLQRAGVPAEFDHGLVFEFTPTIAPAGELYAAITTAQTPHWFVHGQTTGSYAPFPGTAPFVANWWRASGAAVTKMATTIKEIAFFDASGVSFFTARSNFIGHLIGGNTITKFTELPVRGVFKQGEMVVTVRR